MKKNLSFLFVFGVFFIFSQTVPPNTRLFQPTQTQGYFNDSFVKHLNSEKNEIYLALSGEGVTNYYGTDLSVQKTRFVSRIGQDGIPIWTAKYENETSSIWDFNIKRDIASVDTNDNIIVLSATSGASTLTDAQGNIENISFDSSLANQFVIFKLDKNGNKVWVTKNNNFNNASVVTDNLDDVYIVGRGIINGAQNVKTIIIKLDGNTGNVIYTKSYDYNSYQFIPVFDNQNNMYIFTEPVTNPGENLQFDNISIAGNSHGLNNLMLKFDQSGNVIWGKNFYTNLSVPSYSWINDAVFDGENIIVLGSLYKNSASDLNFIGLDNINIPAIYPSMSGEGLIAKINLSGDVLWQKAISTSQNNYSGFYTSISLDENKNFYGYFNFKDRVSADNIEYSFDSNVGNKVISKFDTNGNLKYFSAVDNGTESSGGTNYNSRAIDVIADNQFNISGITLENLFLNYSITNTANAKFYVATFGNLNGNYMTPENNYLVLSNVVMTNNPDNANTFSFNLINNVNWTATSDQNWLTLSYVRLSQKTSPTNTISDNGDTKITMNAETNNSGGSRTANILISGDNDVASQTIAVTQSGVLATGESKTFVTTLYPNPTSDILNIQTEQKILKIEVYDLQGKLLKLNSENTKSISVSTLNKGIYLIRIYTENGVVNSKFIKE